MRRMKTEWELVNFGECNDAGNIVLDKPFTHEEWLELLHGDMLIVFDRHVNTDLIYSSVTSFPVINDKTYYLVALIASEGCYVSLDIDFEDRGADIVLSTNGEVNDILYIYKRS